MGKVFDHIVDELANITAHEKRALRELLDKELELTNGNESHRPVESAAAVSDPLAGLHTSTGIADLAERFDDYRFGRKAL